MRILFEVIDITQQIFNMVSKFLEKASQMLFLPIFGRRDCDVRREKQTVTSILKYQVCFSLIEWYQATLYRAGVRSRIKDFSKI